MVIINERPTRNGRKVYDLEELTTGQKKTWSPPNNLDKTQYRAALLHFATRFEAETQLPSSEEYKIAATPCRDLDADANTPFGLYATQVFMPRKIPVIAENTRDFSHEKFKILNVTKIEYNKHFSWLLFGISIFVFLVAASPGILDIYYKEVSFKIVNGVSTLVKDYGGWHSLYLFYLIGYFGSMVAIIIRAAIKKTIDSTAHAVIIAIAVFVNICVWFVEQIVTIDFEMLSISYIISELFLLGVHLVMNENQKLKDMVQQVQTVQNFTKIENTTANSVLEIPVQSDAIDTERFTVFINGVNQLTATEKAIYEAYIARMTTKEIMAYLNIKENTLKFHNKNLYSKLGVTSRKELVEVYKQISSVKEKI